MSIIHLQEHFKLHLALPTLNRPHSNHQSARASQALSLEVTQSARILQLSS